MAVADVHPAEPTRDGGRAQGDGVRRDGVRQGGARRDGARQGGAGQGGSGRGGGWRERFRSRAPLPLSLVALAVAALWLAAPGSYPYGMASPVTVGVNHWIERDLGIVLLLASGAAGLVAVAVRRPRIVTVVAAAEAAFFLGAMSDAAVLSTVGYAAIPALAVGVAAFVVTGCVRRHPAGYAGAAVLAAVAAAFATGLLDTAVITSYLGNLGEGLGRYGVRILWSWLMAALALAWAVVAFAAVPASGAPAPPNPRRGRVVTILAALCAAPYAVARLSWATPWPLAGFDPATDRTVLLIPALDPATRLQGFLIGLGSLAALVLTLGLTARWGEVFPRWIPALRGRPVPVKLAVIPAAIAAIVFAISSPGVLAAAAQHSTWQDALLFLALFPCPLWSPLLAAATHTYWHRRTHHPLTP
ncbi:hypothetical protein [Bailinhaonella thermotolerans]|uniref:Uncharacterized protein n=1 Tax=Bailinhaonella thermotolerans TaxID=1070861 RepID=A0A3A4BMT9_9ACTN|nr:hypothetical protein [Bailinhaonella thermotolerans]RJL32394.1 hypothetical protein D5H75_12665 [Bailinhaonella thermotolerans]